MISVIDKINFKEYKNLIDRDILRKILLEIGKIEKTTILLGVDSLESGSGNLFREKFPGRVFDFGIAEANMISAAAGFSLMNKIPIASFYGFLISRIAEQIRDDICYNNCNVKLITNTSCFNLATAGVTHHGTDDISILNIFPNIAIIQPSTPIEAIVAVFSAVLEYQGPVYLRLTRQMSEEIYKPEQIKQFRIGKSITIQNGTDITLIAAGRPLLEAHKAAKVLSKKGISVRLIDMHTIKPIDKDAIIKAAKETKAIITIEDGNLNGGLGDNVCRVTSSYCPTIVKTIGISPHEFTVIGPSEDILWDFYGISSSNIEEIAYQILN